MQKVKYIIISILLFWICYSGYSQTQSISHRFIPVRNKTVNTIDSDLVGYLWLGASDGLYKFDGNYLKKINLSKELENKEVYTLCISENRKMWVGMQGGVLIYDYYNGSENWKPFALGNKDIIAKQLVSFGSDVWMLTERGVINKWNEKSEKFEVFNFNDKRLNVCKSIQASSSYLWVLSEDKQLYRVDMLYEDIEPVVVNGTVNVIKAEKDNQLLIGTEQGGVYVIDAKTLEQTQIIKKTDHLPIRGLAIDVYGSIWGSVDNIFFGTNIKQKDSKPTYISQRNVTSFSHNCIHTNNNSEVFIGGKGGVVVFYAGTAQKFPSLMQTYFSDITENNISKCVYDVDNEDKYVFEKDNLITFYFSNLQFTNLYSVRYKYRLIGSDDEQWKECMSGVSHFTFSNLATGDYVLEIITTNKDSWPAKAKKTFNFKVQAVYYKSFWFKILVAFSGVSIIFYIFRTKVSSLYHQRFRLEQLVEERTSELTNKNQEINLQNEEIKQRNQEILSQTEYLTHQKEKIELQNQELKLHRVDLEKMVRLRTIDLEEAKREAEESDRLKTSFLSNLSHELRTPLNAIVGFCSMIDHPDISADQRKEFVKLINANSSNLLRLFDDIIEVSKIEAEKIQLKTSCLEIDITLLDVQNTILEFKERDNKDTVEINFIPHDRIKICTDHMRVKQILVNLLENALKYTEFGSIEYGFVLKDPPMDFEKNFALPKNTIFKNKMLEFFVRDTGIGIKKEMTNIIFDSFRKVEDHATKLYRGTGIGLTISQKLVEMLGGSIWVDSEYGRGSTFYFTLPYIQKTKEDPVRRKFLNNKTILVAEDEKINQMFLEQVLKKTGAKFQIVKDGEEVMQYVDNLGADTDLDMLLLDIKMPKLNGYQVVKLLKERGVSIPILAQTAFATKKDKDKMKQAGFVDVIAKPFTSQELLQFIQKYI